MTSNSYINLARKYRPSIIADLIGQDSLVQTLDNAFKLNRIAHAFMLTGTRGIGKTTTARIIAKALNCTGIDGTGGMTLNPCGQCENCISITQDNHLDVIEMDAASKTSVDDVREIIENSKYKPLSARYKVFIIDEVHMLSKSAFNALLKTLEEPATHLKFIFATTEIRKVPITVLSRCQKFDLQRITMPILLAHLQNICTKENIQFENSALEHLAKLARGSVRDSLSLLDQAIVYAGNNITAQTINNMIGSKGKEDVYSFFNLIATNDNQAFNFIKNQYDKGTTLDIFFEDLQEVCHNATVFKLTNSKDLLDLTDTDVTNLQNIANNLSQESLLQIWEVLLQGNIEIKSNSGSLQTANMITAKLLLATSLTNVKKLLSQLTNKELSNSKADNSATIVSTYNQQLSPTEPIIQQTISQEMEVVNQVAPTQNKPSLSSTSNMSTEPEQVPWVTNPLNINPQNTSPKNEEDIIKEKVKSIFPNAKFEGNVDM